MCVHIHLSKRMRLEDQNKKLDNRCLGCFYFCTVLLSFFLLNAQGGCLLFDLLHVCIGSDLYVDVNQSIVLGCFSGSFMLY